ncbi:12757_t:CDS:2 [Acaulospora colombiana]|uniref:12757_t:CDS:1 n=1 Tax=Acaulospora colombiana TaxID=27376 RepID=A0ACA9NJT9_9GLOM|nr:12757_t:CDS:2 [Acaulospora colombiana]
MSKLRDDRSDSEDEQDSIGLRDGGYTSVHLGIPSDVVEEEADLQDPYVSRIGGTPSFLTYPHPSFDASKCKVCGERMELLLHANARRERKSFIIISLNSVLIKFPNRIRAWRGLNYDEKYARKLKRKQEKKQQQSASKESTSQASSGPLGGPSFGFGDEIMGFASLSTKPEASSKEKDKSKEESEEEDDISEEESEDGSEEEITTKMSKANLGPSPDWSKSSSYRPMYLDTESEYLPPPPKAATSSKAAANYSTGKSSGGGEDWGKEMWEESANIDDVFARFATRVEARAKQCVRYELNGVPLFYQADSVYKSLHSIPSGTSVPVTGAAFVVAGAEPKRTYNPSASPLLSKCPICTSKRRFECQLMPNLINSLKRPDGSVSDNQMEWGTCLIFTCEKNCCQEPTSAASGELRECWREEVVLVQWEE